MQRITPKKQIVYTEELIKTGLSPYGDKRYVMDDGVSTLAFGYYRILNTDGKTYIFPPLLTRKKEWMKEKE